mgnify:CR=1 FL=1
MARTTIHETPKDLNKVLNFIGHYLKKHTAALCLVTLFAVISAGANVYGVYLIKPVINKYILPGDMPGLKHMLIIMGVIYFAGASSTYGYTQLMVKVAQQVVQEIRNDLFCKVQTLPLSFFDANTHGELMSRFTNDIDTIAEVLNNSFTVIIRSAVLLIGTFTMLIVLNPKLSAIVLSIFLCMFLFIRYSSKKSHIFFKNQQKFLGNLDGFVEEMVAGQKVVKVFNHESRNMEGFSQRNKVLQDAGTGAITYSGILVPIVVSLSYFSYALTTCIGAFLVLGGHMDIGSLSAYLVYVRQTAMPINHFSQQFNFILASLSGAERILDVMEEKPEVDDGDVTLVHMPEEKENDTKYERWSWRRPDGGLIPLKGDVRFNDVVFGYEPKKPVLNGINLYAKPGQKIAFVGSTGAGKTTIVNLINRFYDVVSGSITYDGIDLRNIKKDDLRHSIAVVLQDTHLFSGTIEDNIKFGNMGATREQVIKAAKLANADSFIRRLSAGYDTMLSGDGSNLSQGQRQLLSIARAAVSDPPVLILDEATSSIDTHTEKLIESGMDRLMEGRTVFVIAHRLSTVRNAKAILVLEHGEVLERGSHDELIAKKGRYYQLYTGLTELE